MSTYSGFATGRALARLGLIAGRRSGQGSQAQHESRDRVLAMVEAAQQPLLIEDICEATGLHANTVRGHLDTLVAADRVDRTPGPRKGRGRPPWLYSAKEAGAVAELHRSLREQLETADADSVAREAAAAWASTAHFDKVAASPDEAVSQARTTLEELGFSAEESPVGDAIVLRQCPYASLVADNPVICDIHAALLGEILTRSGQDVSVTSLDVWARPGVCVAHLDRPDLRPSRVIDVGETAGVAPTPAGAMTNAAKNAKANAKKKRKR